MTHTPTNRLVTIQPHLKHLGDELNCVTIVEWIKYNQTTTTTTSWLQQYFFITQGQLLSVKAPKAIQEEWLSRFAQTYSWGNVGCSNEEVSLDAQMNIITCNVTVNQRW